MPKDGEKKAGQQNMEKDSLRILASSNNCYYLTLFSFRFNGKRKYLRKFFENYFRCPTKSLYFPLRIFFPPQRNTRTTNGANVFSLFIWDIDKWAAGRDTREGGNHEGTSSSGTFATIKKAKRIIEMSHLHISFVFAFCELAERNGTDGFSFIWTRSDFRSELVDGLIKLFFAFASLPLRISLRSFFSLAVPVKRQTSDHHKSGI